MPVGKEGRGGEGGGMLDDDSAVPLPSSTSRVESCSANCKEDVDVCDSNGRMKETLGDKKLLLFCFCCCC